jgi:uncharacterized tellurite resistance protein B-like protein
MHVLLAVLGVLGAAAFWWYRLKFIGDAAGEIVDAAGWARGAFRRRKFKKRADAATLDSIADPRTAAAVFLVAMATADGPLTAREEAAIRDAMMGVLAIEKPDEEMIFARWAAADVADLNSLVTRFSKVWNARLEPRERRQLYELAAGMAALDGGPDDIQVSALRRLRDRLGLAPAAA